MTVQRRSVLRPNTSSARINIALSNVVQAEPDKRVPGLDAVAVGRGHDAFSIDPTSSFTRLHRLHNSTLKTLSTDFTPITDSRLRCKVYKLISKATSGSEAGTMAEASTSHDRDQTQPPPAPQDAWKTSGVRVIPSDSLEPVGGQHMTPGMDRAAAINFARVGAQKLWAGTVHIHANAKTGVHHHGHLESVIYVLRGRARMRWGEKLEFTAEAGPGDFIYVPPYVPHQEINASADEKLECVLMRSDSEAIAVNLPDVVPVEVPESVKWIDPTHPE
ncbi:hypothetical protein BST61_g7806 [Cercospora zeina]